MTDPTPAPLSPDVALDWQERHRIFYHYAYRSEDGLIDADVENDPDDDRWYWYVRLNLIKLHGEGIGEDADDCKRKVEAWLKANL